MTAQERYEKRMSRRKGRSKFFGLVETIRTSDISFCDYVPRKATGRGNGYKLASGLATFRYWS